MEPCFPGDGWTPACRWEVVNEFLVLFCLHAWLLLYLLNCLYLNPRVFSLLPFWFSPPSHRGGEWASSCVVLSCWLGLNHDIPSRIFYVSTSKSRLKINVSSDSLIKTIFKKQKSCIYACKNLCLNKYPKTEGNAVLTFKGMEKQKLVIKNNDIS